MTAEVFLRRGRARPVWAGHPRVLSGSVDRVEGDPAPGDLVTVRDDRSRAIGRGFYSAASTVRVHMATLDPEEEVDEAYFRLRFRRAARLRSDCGLPSAETDAYRLVHSAGDGLPGVVVDRYADWAVVQLTVAGMERRRDTIARVLRDELALSGVRLNRVRSPEGEEGLEGAHGDLLDRPVPSEVPVLENGVRYLVDPVRGQKTGHYSDHRENRAFVRRMVTGGRVLDAFTGTGGFAISAALGGAAEVLALDSSPRALSYAERNAQENDVLDRLDLVQADVFKHLRLLEREGRRFDAVILDPPRMAVGRPGLKRALRGYKELNLRALRLLAPGGLLATASCTGALSDEDFATTLRDAAVDAGRQLSVFHRSGQGPDHPWHAAAPEGRYLKFLAARA